MKGVYPQWANGYKSTQLDTWSEDAVLGMAIYDEGGSPVDNAIKMHYIEADGLPINLGLTNYANLVDKTYYFPTYERYWHGEVGVLKVLLLFF